MSELLTVFGLNWKLLLIQAVNFGLLLAVLSYFLYKPILKILDERKARIAEGVRKSEEAEKRLADAASRGDSIVGAASREAESLVAGARTRANEQALEIIKSAEGRADAVLADAAARAEEEKRQALLESEKEITRAALLAAEKLLSAKR